MIRHMLLTLNRAAVRALARKWFLRGFAHSGKGFHGETYDLSKFPALESLLASEFDRVWDQENPR